MKLAAAGDQGKNESQQVKSLRRVSQLISFHDSSWDIPILRISVHVTYQMHSNRNGTDVDVSKTFRFLPCAEFPYLGFLEWNVGSF